MDHNNGKPLSPWKVPSRISLKRIRHKINSDLNLQSVTASALEKNAQKQNGKRNRLMMNKFALARSISTPTSEENIPSPVPPSMIDSSRDDHLLARLHQIMPPPPAASLSSETNFNSAMKSFSLDTVSNKPESNRSADELISSFPIDWSLKSSCRFYSSDSSAFLSNLMKLRSSDESRALEHICSNSSQENDKAHFRSLTSYWTHPHIAWLRLFPRTIQQTNTNFPPMDEQAQLALQDEWKAAFQSLFQAFRTKYCSFFYMCTHTFNVLFREDASAQVLAIISPTTSGLRSTLAREGIDFVMADGGDPLNNSASKTNEDDDENGDENEDENDANCVQWLEDMGLSASSSSHTMSTAQERRSVSSKKKSATEKARLTTILVRDPSSVNSLFNFLLNKSQRTCMSLTGPLAGIPPTLLAPRPFLNSTLRYLNVHFQSNAMVTIDGGPILPDRLKGLWHLLTENDQEINLTCNNVERTSTFNLEGEQEGRTLRQIQIDGDRHLRAQFLAL